MSRAAKRWGRRALDELAICGALGLLLWILLSVVSCTNPLLAAEGKPGRPILDVWFDASANSRAFSEAWNKDADFRRAVESVYELRFIDACKVPEAAVARGVTGCPCFEVRGRRGRLYGFRGVDVLLSELNCPRLEALPPPDAARAAEPKTPRPAPLPLPAVVGSILPNPDLVAINVKLDSLDRQSEDLAHALQAIPRCDAAPAEKVAELVGRRFDESFSRHSAAVGGRLAQTEGSLLGGLAGVVETVKGFASSDAAGGVSAVGAPSWVVRFLGVVISQTPLGAALLGSVGTGGMGLAVWGVIAGVRWIRRRRRLKSAGAQAGASSAGVSFPVAIDSPTPPQVVVREKHFTPVERDSTSEALSYAVDQVVRKHPGAETVCRQLQSIMDQFLAAKGVK